MADFPRWRRRRFLVNRKIQLRFMALLLLQMSFILMALGILVHSHVRRTAEIATGVPFVDARTRMALENELIDSIHGFYVRSLLLIGVTVALLVVFGLLASHKLAGPVLKLERYLNAIADGDYSQRIAFRRKDHLDQFAENVNRMAESIEGRREKKRELAQELAQRSERLDVDAERASVLADMERLVAAIRGAV